VDPADAGLIRTLVAACDVADEIFWRQNSADGVAWRERVRQSRVPRRDHLLRYLRINGGRYDLLADGEAFLGTGTRPPARGYYPPDLTRDALESYLAEHPADRPDLEQPNTVVRREGSRLVSVPYHLAYADLVARLAALLDTATTQSAYPTFSRYLRQRAADLRTDDYFASDCLWVDLADTPFDLVIGPYESYGDELLGAKAAFEAVLMRVDAGESARLETYKAHVPALEQAMPTPPALKAQRAGGSSPFIVANSLYRTGDAVPGYQMIAFNLPNDPRVHEEKGSKKVIQKNFLDLRVQTTIRPIADRLLDPSVAALVTSRAYFDDVLFHEISHGLGTRTVIGTDRNVRAALGPAYADLEEAKADVCGLICGQYFIQQGLLPASARIEHLAAFVGGALRSIRFGDEAHAVGARMHLNRLLQDGGLTHDAVSGRFAVDYDRVETVMRAHALDLLTIQATGDAPRAHDFVTRLGATTPPLQAAIDAVAAIPIDFEPVYRLDV
jgi:hypothetical protein